MGYFKRLAYSYMVYYTGDYKALLTRIMLGATMPRGSGDSVSRAIS